MLLERRSGPAAELAFLQDVAEGAYTVVDMTANCSLRSDDEQVRRCIADLTWVDMEIESRNGYHCGMSTQITVRLSDEIVTYLDRTVSSGQAPSRAAIVTQALERDRLRRAAERDAEILAAAGADSDMDALARFAADTPLDDLE